MATKTILFVHGNFVNYECWDLWVKYYEAKGYTCVAAAYPERNKSVKELLKEHPNPKVSEVTLTATLDHLTGIIKGLSEKPIIIGHSFGGLLTQLLLNRGLAAAAVAIDSVPPQGVLAFSLSFLRSTFPLFNPLTATPWLMPFSHFQYAFANGMALAEQREAYDITIVPESLRLSRGGLGSGAKVDFTKPHAPLLMIGGEIDHIMPSVLNKVNFERYQGSSIKAFKEFPGRNHYTVIAGQGWQEVADYALDWVVQQNV